MSAVIFDMDGLMFDTERLARDAWRCAMAERGYALDDETYLTAVGNTAEGACRVFVDAFGPELPISDIETAKARYLQEMLEPGPPLKPGLVTLLDGLEALGLPLAVASATARAEVERRLAGVGLRRRFDAVVGGDEVARGKPAPDLFVLAAERLGASPAGCVVFEDSEAGVNAAAAAGMAVVMVPDLVEPSASARALAKAVVPSLAEALEVIGAQGRSRRAGRTRSVMRFRKYQGLGNDYIVLERGDLGAGLSPHMVRRICDRHFGVGSDGILVEDAAPDGAFALRIFNPDGSEAEKSGNGLRIFSRYLWDQGRVDDAAFTVATKGGAVRCQVRDSGRTVFVEMGTASFDSGLIPVAGPRREVVDEEISVAGERLRFTAVSVGNPHCVVHAGEISAELARRLGPVLEVHPRFPKRTNVQFVEVLDPHRIAIEIWERGAGYTLASGSSSCAAAAASVRLGRCAGDVTVVMPGGSLEIGVDEHYGVSMQGPVGKVAEGVIADEVLGDAG